MYKYAIIGMGFIYSRHIQAAEKVGGKIIMTCDIDPKKKADFLDYRDMFKSKKFIEKVDAVIVCTPNHLHAKMVRDALKTGKRVLCEKPLIIDNNFDGLNGVNIVLQLRYHPLLKEMQKAIKKRDNKVNLEMKVCRDKDWWNSWRGDVNKSGGPLFGLAIHLFDLLFVLFNDKFNIVYASNSESKCSGILEGKNVRIKYNVEIMLIKEGQTRNFIINDKKFELCNKDNLSFSGYHYLVHKYFINGNGILLSEAKKSVKLIDEIWNKNKYLNNSQN